MKTLRTLWIAAIVGGALFAPAAALADKVGGQRFRSAVALESDGSVLIDNPRGSVIVTGTDRPILRWEAVKHIRAVDEASFREGLERTRLQFEGSGKARVLRTVSTAPMRNSRWEAVVTYQVEVPRTASVTIANVTGETIRISNLDGPVLIRNVTSRIELIRLGGKTHVETVNGSITAHFPDGPRADCRLSSVNGTIQVHLPPTAPFTWIAQTIRGGIHTSVRLQGFFRRHEGVRIYEAVTQRSGPTVETIAVLGETYLLGTGTQLADADPITVGERASAERQASAMRPQPLRPEMQPVYKQIASNLLLKAPSARSFAAQQIRVQGDFRVDAGIGSIFVGEIDGDAKLATRAGEIVVGRLGGQGELHSQGGSLHLGEVEGRLVAHTSVGDVHVRAARAGGKVTTDAGNIEVLFSGGPLQLRSGGGDISVRQATGSIQAETPSGDISLKAGPDTRTLRIAATTEDGNIRIEVPPDFAADIDAVLLVDPDSANSVLSDIPGLTIVREPMGDQVRVRANGRINGGGERVVLRATGGKIQIVSNVSRNVRAFPH